MGKILSKIILCIFFSTILLFSGFIISVFITFISSTAFYGHLVIALDIGITLFVILRIFELKNEKRLFQVLGAYFAICLIAGTGYLINQGYKNSIPSINEQKVDLNRYSPFLKDTKAAKLSEASKLKITDNLPKLDGATALYPLYSAFAQAVYPDGEYKLYDSKVQCFTTEGAYKNLIDGQCDIIFAAKPSQQQLEEAKARGLELKLTPIGREAFVFFVNTKNNITELSKKQIQDIYSGNIINWKEVGGKNENIRAFQRPENSGSQTMLEKLMEGKSLMTPPREDVVSAMDGIIKRTSDYKNYKNAIGYSFLFFATEMVKSDEIRLLKVDGVYPSKETIKGKTYPLSAEFYAVTAGSKNPNIEPFINWILGEQGQYLVEETGYTPIK